MAAKEIGAAAVVAVGATANAVGGFLKQVATDLHPSFQAGLNDAHKALEAFPDSMTPSAVLGQVGQPTSAEVDRSLNAEPYSFEEHMQRQAEKSQARAPKAEREKGIEVA